VQAEREAGRAVADLPRGQHAGTGSGEWEGTRRFATLMHFDVMERAERGDIRQALLSAVACLNAGRHLAEEPFADAHNTRTACVVIAGRGVERALALGAASDADLARAQQAFLHCARTTGVAKAVRLERALRDDMALDLIEGRATISRRVLACSWPAMRPLGWWPWAEEQGLREQAARVRPELLRHTTRLVAVAEMPPHEQAAAEAAVEREAAGAGPLFRLLAPDLKRLFTVARRRLESARVTAALIGCERHRLRKGVWPATLDDLVPTFLPAVPGDPFDGMPLRYARWADGVVVYSVGPDLKEGGDVAGDPRRIASRLWDADKRRRPAPAARDKP
jgi:hypothetical protein